MQLILLAQLARFALALGAKLSASAWSLKPGMLFHPGIVYIYIDRDVRVCGHTATAVLDIEYTPPLPPLWSNDYGHACDRVHLSYRVHPPPLINTTNTAITGGHS